MVKQRVSYTVQKKLEILRQVEESGNLDCTARDLKIDRRCIQRWRNDKAKLLAVAAKTQGAARHHIKRTEATTAKYPVLESRLVAWFKDKRLAK